MLGAISRGEHVLKILPMLTDADAWTDEHLTLYAKLLHTESKHILNPVETFTAKGRDAYFSDAQMLPDNADIFVDPDNGPWTGKSHNNPHRYVKAKELVALLPASSSRIIFVYRHESRCQTALGLQQYLANLFRGESGCVAFGVFCGTTSLICLSRDAERVKNIWDKLHAQFHPIGLHRITDLVKL